MRRGALLREPGSAEKTENSRTGRREDTVDSDSSLTAGSHPIRVEKGNASEEELAAVTALLMARATSAHRATATTRPHRASKAGWRRLDRQHGFRAPHSWQG